MIIVQAIDFLKRHLRAAGIACLALLALLVLGDAFFVDKEHAHTQVEHIPGFWAAFGFLACLTIIFVSKWVGHRGIMQDEDYYGDE
jgi:succinate dehydrogenase hydrophobic anchor subunit